MVTVDINLRVLSGIAIIACVVLWYSRGLMRMSAGLAWSAAKWSVGRLREFSNPVLFALIGAVLLISGIFGGGDNGPAPNPEVPSDIVSRTFALEQQLWRHSRLKTADLMRDGELKTEPEVHAHLEKGRDDAHDTAWRELREAEHELLKDKWKPAEYERLLRSYGNGSGPE